MRKYALYRRQRPRVSGESSAHDYLKVGDLRRLLSLYKHNTRVYVHLNGPMVQLTHATYYSNGINGQPSLILDTSTDDLPKPKQLGLQDIRALLDQLDKQHEAQLASLQQSHARKKQVAKRRTRKKKPSKRVRR